jgi:hypothetical protein
MSRARAFGAATLVLAVLAAPAHAAPSSVEHAHAAVAAATGSLTLTVSARADRALRTRGVTVSTTGKAARSGRRVRLPLSAGDRTALNTSGALRLRAGKRSVTLGAPRLELGSNPRVTALLGGRRSTLLTLTVAPISTASGVTLETTGATLTAAAGRTISRRLRITQLPRAAFATVAATGTFASQAPQPSAPAPGACATTTAGGAAPDPGKGEPPIKARPAGALTIASATVTWHVRESFIQYIASGEGTSTSAGATGEEPTVEGASQAPLVYSFHFTPTGGWCDPATGAARLTFGGSVGFRYRDHEIDLRVNDPEVELDGPASRVIFRMTGSGDTDGGNRRSVVETLDVSKAAAVRVDGKTITYERIPAAVPPGTADSVFAGYYLPGDPFGWVSITFTAA